ncbi:MMPL family transporter [Cellulomonas cellasea]|uniref:RND superfamily putative drug exporter n=1 Tax=Cellulomonas cellasea TaxID=43670 RepID=A0A7W4YAJ6_9CELL|nr:MMPL family transporter [Cellulomonas cellasea]MBB2922673.1 RND superfamily putative drug exporter [Cellulomonas cellasea]
MLDALGRLTHRHARWVLAVSLALAALAAVWGSAVSDHVQAGGFTVPGSDSERAEQRVAEELGPTRPEVLVTYAHPTLTPDDPRFAADLTAHLDALPDDATARVVQPWTPGLPADAQAALLGTDGRSALVAISVPGADLDARVRAYGDLEPSLAAPEPWTTAVGGALAVNADLTHRAETDIAAAETLAMPVLLVLLAVIFGSGVAALLPVVVGVLAILGAMGLLRALTLVTDVSTFAINVTTILGLGLAIDYALFVVSRFREELARTDDVGAAVVRTVTTAGRTVIFSGLTVLIAFAGLLAFPQMFLRSMGLGGMAVVLLDMVLAVTLLPALLALLGRRVDAGRLPRGITQRLAARRVGRTPVWTRLGRGVLRRPGLVAAGVTAVLVLVALPALGLVVGSSDERDLPASSPARQATEQLADLFPGGGSEVTLDVVLDGAPQPAALDGYLTGLGALPDAGAVRVVAATDRLTSVAVTAPGAVDAPETRDLVRAVRALDGPAGTDGAPVEVLVGGAAAANVDSTDAIASALPWALLVIAGATAVLLFLALGSLVLPVKAIVLNVLSLGATFGAVWWAFGDAHLAGALGFTATGRIDPSNLVLIGVIAFGLAMDYELFLLSRVREEHLRGRSADDAVVVGLERTGRTITSAALLLVVVLVAMGTSGVAFLKVIGLGLAFAVLVDATLVRALLVPATVRLLGRSVWWLPAPLARLHARAGLSEGEAPAERGTGAGGGADTGAGAATDGRPRELVGTGA